MSVSGTYGVGGISGVEGIWDMGGRARNAATSGKGDSGDTVSISDEAKELLRKKLGRYSASGKTSEAGTGQSASGSSVAGLSGNSGEDRTSGAGGDIRWSEWSQLC